jgi:peptidoglycan LD-endopeptidase LytH
MWEPFTFRRILLGVILTQSAMLLAVLFYLAITDSTVRVELAPRERVAAAPWGPQPLAIPVAGVRHSELRDTYGAPRSGGRTHEGIDIFAAEGTPVLAASTGIIVGRDSSTLGGISLYKRDLDGRTIYFYGHLQRYETTLKEGDMVRQGDVIAYVGQTGNVPPGRPHLHFSVYTVPHPNRWWRGRNISPCDLLSCGDSIAGSARAE